MIGVTVVAFIVSCKSRNRDKQLQFITYYISASLLIDCISIYYELFLPNAKNESISISIFMLFEITIFFIYIKNNINNVKLKMTIKTLFISFLILVFCIGINYSSLCYRSNSWLPVIESLFLIIPCFFYFFELFISHKIILKNHSSFWVVTGILFYNCCSIPIYLLSEYILKNMPSYFNIVFSLNYILYTILFLLFIKAYLCKKEATSY